MRTIAGFVIRFGLLLLLLVVVGCDAGQGKVSGKVLYKGEPLPGGRVTFLPADPKQNSVSAALNEQGNYEAVLPAGEVKVSIDNRELEPRPPRLAGAPKNIPAGVLQKLGKVQPPPRASSGENAPNKPPGRYVKIPNKYYSSDTSGLQFTVQRGDQPHDIELK